MMWMLERESVCLFESPSRKRMTGGLKSLDRWNRKYASGFKQMVHPGRAGAAIKKAEEKLQPRIFQNRVFRV